MWVELKKRLLKEMTALAVVFILLMLTVSISFFSLNNSLNKIITEAEPTQHAMEHMVRDVYRDNIVLLEYLNSEDYVSATMLDSKVKESNKLCSRVENDIENLIMTGALSNEKLISDYEDAFLLHSQVEDLRDDIIALHKEELATSKDLSSQKSQLLENHSIALDKAISMFTLTAEEIQSRNDLLKDKMSWQSKLFAWVVMALIVVFIIITIAKIKKISLEVIEPIDKTIDATKKFVNGDFGSRISPINKFAEIGELQDNINKVFSVINNETNKGVGEKKKVDMQLLKKEYIEILEYVSSNTRKKIKTNITDLKKYLNITHPTLLERLHYLEKRGFIKTNKEGREKFISVTGEF